MRIGETSPKDTKPDFSKVKEKVKTKTGTGPVRADRENRTEIAEIERTAETGMGSGSPGRNLEEVIREIDEQAERFLKKPVMEELARYKELIKNFIRSALSATFRIEERVPTVFAKTIEKKKKIYIIAEMINGKMDELTREVLSSQRDALKLSSKIDEIRGLLMDLKG